MIRNNPPILMPTLLVDMGKCRHNIHLMALKAKKNRMMFRPHFKTHQSEVVGNLFKEAGIKGITVSSLRMAKEFAQQGWNDITVAFPVNILEIDLINYLVQNIKLNLLVESVEVVNFLNSHLQAGVTAFIKIDTGYRRTGIASTNYNEISILIKTIENSCLVKFKGFLVHSGQSYQAQGLEELELIHKDCITQLTNLKLKYSADFPQLIFSMGDTPTCSTQNVFEGIDEIRPGNFVYYDATQLLIGSCLLNQIAAFMACPIVAVHPERNELVLYGGAIHFSKDSLSHPIYGTCYGLVIDFTPKGVDLVPDCFIKTLSQEHGIVRVTNEYLKTKKPGDLLYAIPAHSCLTANLMKNNTLYF